MDKIKNIALLTAFFVFLTSTVINTKRQVEALIGAWEENRQVKQEIETTEKNIRILRNKIEYASNSAYFVEQKARELLGLGSHNDYWITVKEEIPDLYPEFETPKETPNWKLWFDLFARN